MTVADGTVSIAAREIVRGVPVGTVVVEQSADGPHCIGESGH